MLNCCLIQLHRCLTPLRSCLGCPTSQASRRKVSDIRSTPHKHRSRNCAGRRSSSRARLAQHPQSPIACLVALLRLASFAPPLRYAQGVAEISKNPNPRPPLLLILHPHWSLQPLASTDRPPPPEPCQFDVPGVALSTSPILPERPKQCRG